MEGSGTRPDWDEIARTIYRTVRRRVHPDDAEDVAHDALLRVIKLARSAETGIAHWAALAHRAARFECADWCARRSRQLRLLPLPPHHVGMPSVSVGTRDLLDRIPNEFLASFPPRQRRVFLAIRDGAGSHREIARNLDIGPSDVRAAIRGLTQRLRRLFEGPLRAELGRVDHDPLRPAARATPRMADLPHYG